MLELIKNMARHDFTKECLKFLVPSLTASMFKNTRYLNDYA